MNETQKKSFVIFFCVQALILAIGADETTTEGTPSPVNGSVSGGEILSKRKSTLIEENVIEGKSQRHPKFGFTIPLPNIPGNVGDSNSTPLPTADTSMFGGLPPDVGQTTATLGTTAVLIKGGILSGLTALKAAIFPPLFLGALVVFLIAGAAFFTCSIINCRKLIGEFGGGPGSPFSGFNGFNRNGIDEYEQIPVYQAIENGYNNYS